MALNLVSRVQVTASRFINKRNSTALSHHGVRLEYDPESRRVAALTLGVTLALVATGVMFLLSWFKPAGQVGSSPILADRDTANTEYAAVGRAASPDETLTLTFTNQSVASATVQIVIVWPPSASAGCLA